MSPALARALFALLDTAIAALLALAALAFITGGLHLDLEVADISIRSRTRPVAIAAVLMIVRAWAARRAARTPHLPSSDRDRRPANGARFPQSGPAAPARIVLLALVLTAVGYWLAFLTMVCGGSDSYGYVSASGLLLRGSLVEPQPIASWLPVANALDVATPAGYVPSGDRSGIAPMYPLGLPLLMAAMTLVAGASGPYLVAPIAGVVSLILVAGIAVAWQARGSRSSAESGACDRWIGGLAAALVAWNPLMMAYAKQPMSDVPATMWFLAAVWALVRDPARPLAAGLLAGLSFLTRPGGLGSLAALAALAWFGAADRRGSVARFALGFAPWAALQALLQWHLFGSPFQTGYGSLAALYAGQSIADNLAIYATGFLSVHSAWWLAALALAAAAPRRDALVWGLLTMLLGGVAYLFYLRFDHWETLRFMLPGITLLAIAAASGLAWLGAAIDRRFRYVGCGVALVCAMAFAARSAAFLQQQGVPGLREAEARYPDTAERVARLTPPASIVLAAQHSGSVRHYANRTTLRWDLLRPEDLPGVLAALDVRGLTAFVVLEGEEQQRFRERFSGALQTVSMLPAAQVRQVQIWELR